MSMHMIRGIQVHGKSKVKRKPGWKKAMAEHEAFLKKMGVTHIGGDLGYEAIQELDLDVPSEDFAPIDAVVRFLKNQ